MGGSRINLSYWRKKNAVIALVNDDLEDRDNQIQAIKYENLALQAQGDVYQDELQRCQESWVILREFSTNSH